MRVRIVHIEGSRAGQAEELALSQVMLGRDTSCHVIFDAARDDRVSTRHALITLRGNDLILSDLGSRNGTLLNDRPVTGPTLLPENAVVQLGKGGPKIRAQIVPDAPSRHRYRTGPVPVTETYDPTKTGKLALPGGGKGDDGGWEGCCVEQAGVTDVGPTRKDNQDAFHAAAPLFIVCDGCGGQKGGETASHMTVDAIINCLADPQLAARALALPGKTRPTPAEHELAAWVRLANKLVHDRSKEVASLNGMATTLVLCWLVDHMVVIASAGDSRIYRIRKGEMEQVTEDDSWVNSLYKDGLITKAEMLSHPDKNVLTASVGTKGDLEANTLTLKPEVGDVFLLCSDGVYGPVPENDMLKIVLEKKSLDASARELITQAARRGGYDNATAVLFRILTV